MMSNRGSAKDAMIEVAERMFAERGLDGVSMRDVASAAGQKNNSAVQYHFGGRDGLILEVFRRRMAVVNAAREEFLATIDDEGRGQDVRALVEAVLVPLANYIAERGVGSYYAQFLVRVTPSLDFDAPDLAAISVSSREVSRRLMDVLDHLPRRVAVARVDLMLNMGVSALAVFEQRCADDNPVAHASFAETVHHVIDMSVAALEAPCSPMDSADDAVAISTIEGRSRQL
ncbi:TetR family transcriptional regulator [Rhodococcus sp. R1101]|uniref:TetR family transcriptional regulator n=1 Tax=Rhodococcus sp. R1101 TaxID=1170698 RepID=UPI0003827568|nr:TetR family transcriptional regulator [Rhodococcus sp. R1101]